MFWCGVLLSKLKIKDNLAVFLWWLRSLEGLYPACRQWWNNYFKLIWWPAFSLSLFIVRCQLVNRTLWPLFRGTLMKHSPGVSPFWDLCYWFWMARAIYIVLVKFLLKIRWKCLITAVSSYDLHRLPFHWSLLCIMASEKHFEIAISLDMHCMNHSYNTFLNTNVVRLDLM
jgi:hypothetical protein